MNARSKAGSRAAPAGGLSAIVAALALTLPAAGARADGAFPDSLNIITPEQLPNETLLATNFGVIMSFDDEQTWTWACEQTLNSFATLYQMGPAPRNRIFAISGSGVIYTDDTSCTWNAAGGVPAGTALDVFADQSDPNHVLAISAVTLDAGALMYDVLSSSDGGTTFPNLLYTAAPGDHLTGVEVSRSSPSTIYLTLTSGTSYVPEIAQSTDSGAHWTVHNLAANLAPGTYTIRLVAVDPTNPQKVFLRVGSAAGEALAVTQDGGVSASSPLTFPAGSFNAYTRMASGTIIAGGVVGTSNVAYRSTDQGNTFQPLPAALAFRGLSSRGTTLYAASDNVSDGYAIETSPDEGMTWQPVMNYDQIQAIQTCVSAACQTDCLARAGMGQWSSDMCSASVMEAPIDAGAGGSTGAGNHAGGTGGQPGQSGKTGTDAGAKGGAAAGESSGGGCKCGLAAGQTTPLAALAVLLLAAGLTAGTRRRRS